MKWEGGGIDPPGHLGDGRAMRLAIDRRVQEGGVPAWREQERIRWAGCCLSEEKGREVGRRQRQCTGQDRGLLRSYRPSLCRRTRGWGGKTLIWAEEGWRRDLRTEREGRENDRGCRRCGCPRSWGQRHGGSDSGGERGKCRNSGRRDGGSGKLNRII